MEVPGTVVALTMPYTVEARLKYDGARVVLDLPEGELALRVDYDTARRMVEDKECVKVLLVMDDPEGE